MVTILKKSSSIETLKKVIDKATRKSKGVNAHKYLGVLDSKTSAIAIQKKLRDEWQ
jgi:hypothetical protein